MLRFSLLLRPHFCLHCDADLFLRNHPHTATYVIFQEHCHDGVAALLETIDGTPWPYLIMTTALYNLPPTSPESDLAMSQCTHHTLVTWNCLHFYREANLFSCIYIYVPDASFVWNTWCPLVRLLPSQSKDALNLCFLYNAFSNLHVSMIPPNPLTPCLSSYLPSSQF